MWGFLDSSTRGLPRNDKVEEASARRKSFFRLIIDDDAVNGLDFTEKRRIITVHLGLPTDPRLGGVTNYQSPSSPATDFFNSSNSSLDKMDSRTKSRFAEISRS